ncbi:head decoration protein [Bradyrhizobium sp. Pha-3]|uniref:head decoration protein n=1 Tax=Bradyrhizobium sp. Pha-3 TaxID=208375 RepID=UPI0035D52300
MTTSPTNVYDNADQPSATAYTYLPDQLIAGGRQFPTETVTVTGNAALKRGTVLGQKSSGDVGAAVAGGSNAGDGAISAISKGANYKPGQYKILFTGATAYQVIDPLGEVVGSSASAGAFTSQDINFTFATHTNPMVAGDYFTIAIAAGTGPYKASVSGAGDGSQTPTAILADDCDPTAGDVRAGVYLAGEFNKRAITLDASISIDSARSSLRSVGIILKGSVSAADPT